MGNKILGGDDVSRLSSAIQAALFGVNKAGLAIVFYHTDADDSAFKAVRSGVAPEYAKLIAASNAAARKAHPEAAIINLTDRGCNLFASTPGTTIRLPVDPNWVGYERCRAWYAFCQVWRGKILFLDTDMFIRTRLDDLFTRDFDFALTWRPPSAPAFQNMPINGGMFIVNDPQKAADFMRSEIWACGIAAQAQNDESKLSAFAEQQGLAVLTNFRGPGVYQTWWGKLEILLCAMCNSDYNGKDNHNPKALIWHLKGGLKKYLVEIMEALGL